MWLSNYLFLDIMDNDKKRIEKIYSRKRIKIPNIEFSYDRKQKNEKKELSIETKEKIQKIFKILVVLIIAFLVSNMIIKAIEPIIEAECVTIAKSIATKISNEQATNVMKTYEYEDLTNITKDENGNIKMINSNIITINKIISDIPILMQEELDKEEHSQFYIRLGSFTGSKILAGRGPKVAIKMSVNGNVETDLRSEFSSAGINQTLHRIYLEVRCNVIILTPFNTIEEQIVNQVLLAEGVIVGEIPNTYYNLEGIGQDQVMEVME